MAVKSRSYTGIKEPVQYTTTGNITLSGLGVQINGDWPSTLTSGDRILVKDQSVTTQNGIYNASSSAWTRSRDADGHGELVAGSVVPVAGGATALGSVWTLNPLSPGAIDPGTTNISFELAQSTLLIPYSDIDQPNGVAGLDGAGKINSAALPPGGLTYQGTWDASTNSPTLADGVGSGGDLYVVSVAGTRNLGSGSISFLVGDFVIYNNSNVWERVPTGGGTSVSSVNGQNGAVVINLDDINDVTLGSLADGALLRYDSSGGGVWGNTTSSTLVLTADGQLRLPSSPVTPADGGIVIGSGVTSVNLYRPASGVLKTDGSFTIGSTSAGKSTLSIPDTNTSNKAGVTIGSDTNIYRDAADTLKTDDTLVVAKTGGNKNELQISDTTLNTGLTIGADVNLYRSASGVLKTDSAFAVGSTSAGKSTISIPDTNTSNKAGITIGGDTNIYRDAANTLKTDDKLDVGVVGGSKNEVQISDNTVNSGLTIGSDGNSVNLYRSAANTLKTDGKMQQNTAPSTGDDLTNKTYVDSVAVSKRTATYTTTPAPFDSTAQIVFLNPSAAFTVTLPAAATAGAGRVYTFVDISDSAATKPITLDGNGTELINGSTVYTININRESVTLVSTGTGWTVI